MYIIYDCDDYPIGTITDYGMEHTEIAQVLMEEGLSVRKSDLDTDS